MKTKQREQPKLTRLPEQRWEQARDAYVRGEGSLRSLAERFNVSLATMEARCRREGWVKLRHQREQGALKQLVGEAPVSVAQGPIAPASFEDVEWWSVRDKEHLLQNLGACGKIRQAVETQIGSAKAGDLEKLANAVRALTETERELLE